MLKALILLLSFALFIQADEKDEIAKVSEAMGHMIGKNLQSLGLPLDLQAVLKGMEDASQGKSSPLAEEEYEHAITKLQEQSHELAATKNLSEANAFLKKNAEQEGIVTLEQGKLQYKVKKEGDKEAPVVQSYNTPLVRYRVHALNGEPLAADIEEELIVLDEALLGLKEGIVGMKEGEERTLYIHPEWGYGKESYVPNALLIFDVEVIKADTAPASTAEGVHLLQTAPTTPP